MNLPDNTLSPPKRLAIAYAQRKYRGYLELLLAFDDRMASVVLRATEPLIAQMRLAWWNDVIGKNVQDRPSGEPFLAVLAEAEMDYPHLKLPETMIQIADSWGILLANEEWSTNVLHNFADMRGKAIFGSYARVTGVETRGMEKAGQYWALADLLVHAHNDSYQQAAATAFQTLSLPTRLPRKLRSLGILLKSAELEAKNSNLPALRMLWHILTGY